MRQSGREEEVNGAESAVCEESGPRRLLAYAIWNKGSHASLCMPPAPPALPPWCRRFKSWRWTSLRRSRHFPRWTRSGGTRRTPVMFAVLHSKFENEFKHPPLRCPDPHLPAGDSKA